MANGSEDGYHKGDMVILLQLPMQLPREFLTMNVLDVMKPKTFWKVIVHSRSMILFTQPTGDCWRE